MSNLDKAVDNFIAMTQRGFEDEASFLEKFTHHAIGNGRRSSPAQARDFAETLVEQKQDDEVLELAEALGNANPTEIQAAIEKIQDSGVDLNTTYGRNWDVATVAAVYMVEQENHIGLMALDSATNISDDAKSTVLAAAINGTNILQNAAPQNYSFIDQQESLPALGYADDRITFLTEQWGAELNDRDADSISRYITPESLDRIAQLQEVGVNIELTASAVETEYRNRGTIYTLDNEGQAQPLPDHVSEELATKVMAHLTETGQLKAAHVKTFVHSTSEGPALNDDGDYIGGMNDYIRDNVPSELYNGDFAALTRDDDVLKLEILKAAANNPDNVDATFVSELSGLTHKSPFSDSEHSVEEAQALMANVAEQGLLTHDNAKDALGKQIQLSNYTQLDNDTFGLLVAASPGTFILAVDEGEMTNESLVEQFYNDATSIVEPQAPAAQQDITASVNVTAPSMGG